MPRLSLWKDGKHSNDYRYFDRQISEMFTVGGTGINVHKYLGTLDQSFSSLVTTQSQTTPGTTLTFANTSTVKTGDFVFGTGITTSTKISSKTATTIVLSQPTTQSVPSGTTIKFSESADQPAYINESEKNIQDLLFLENRDRKYDTDVYSMRGIYTVSDTDFDLTQFGLFLSSTTLFMSFHLNDMIEILGRRLMNGDVLELMHLKDYNPLDEDLPTALKRYYVVNDASRASEGFSPTWWAHLWRVKLTPLVDSQEYKDILKNITASEDSTTTLEDLLSTYQKFANINDAVIAQAESDVPLSGYDTVPLYTKGLKANGYPEDPNLLEASDQIVINGNSNITADNIGQTPDKSISGYLTGDGIPPNGYAVTSGISFPANPALGAYFLRLDFKPNRLFRWNGTKWVKVEDKVRTNLTPGSNNKTLRSNFVNNTNTHTNSNDDVYNERQALNKIFKPRTE